VSGYHQTRFAEDQRRDVLWKTLCDAYFQRHVRESDAVLDLGCGYGSFINNIRCASKVAMDQWSGAPQHLKPDVKAHVGDITDLSPIPDRSVDFVFSSNVFEHLTRPDFARCLAEVKRVLRSGGTLNIVQPNYRFCYDEYFDDYTHVSIFSDRSLCDALEAEGFRVLECIPRFLPLTIKSRLPVSPLLIRTYLALPFKPMGKQMLVRAQLATP
jgi:SAM-dependent methyltransferase